MAESLLRFILNARAGVPITVSVIDNNTPGGRLIFSGDLESCLHGVESSWMITAVLSDNDETELEIWVDTTYDPVYWAE